MAEPTFVIFGGGLTATRLIPGGGGGELDDVRGSVLITVSSFANPVTITDSTNGTDPNFLTLPFGNSTLTGFVSTPEADSITFNFTSEVISPTTDTLTAIGSALFPVPNTDPALLAFDQPLLYTFDLSNFGTLAGTNTTEAQYTLTSIQVATPEPATAGIFALGLIMLFGYLRLRRGITAG